ncbi:hypothetical protein ASPZODRAFT_150796 [Penicilliopsis zonata CBS 506.65]|uniref:Peptidase M20 domain-containing protein 2 n=1 Tax=Penicilliopsis zonata CBS 506.65 TaxID=1073090 RepID=A0A1L9SNC1_9EURO|nr:hypothetical protein ASPZODRAFT_150796 [Penicilliopsis zonata CBS 506.65]OJJ48601.1 hypothetical protein ASPZODRAFT_150796 [Penicilliopsis zonata CBS 506.65]
MWDQNIRSQYIESVKASLQKYDEQLKDVNQKIWSNPELSFEEFGAHDNICALFDTLAGDGYQVQRSVYGMKTAFEIEYKHGAGGRTVAFNAEYDALPGIGHACGHNLIATSSIAAFLATCEAMKALSPPSDGPGYTVRLLGTPAEEGGGGKTIMIDAGAYKDVDACLMLHPVPMAPQKPELLSVASILPGGYMANDQVTATFTGKPAHAAGAPWEGLNALDAVVAAYVNISLLRQQILPSQRIHGVITNGGARPNIIPMSASVLYYIRSQDVKTLKLLTERVVKCFEAAAVATGCTLDLKWGDSYKDLRSNVPICESYVDTMRAMGHLTLFDNTGLKSSLSGASTDMGNVSYEIPGFHGVFTIPTEGVNHTPGFTAGAGSVEGYERSMHCAAGMAVAACQVLIDDAFAARVKADFDNID